jgi:uncharacterized protein
MRATLDTNVLVSGMASLEYESSTPAEILRRWIVGQFELVLSASILNEIERTLTKPYYQSHRSFAQISAAEQVIAREATIIAPTVIISGVASHPEDDLVLSVAVSANVDYLVTGDRQFQKVGFHRGVTILSPRAFLDLLEAI